MTPSPLEITLVRHIQAVGLPLPLREYSFHPVRRWRFDMAWPDHVLAMEVEGGVWTGGRHTRGAGFIADIEKYNEAVLLGWRVLRTTGELIRRGEAIRCLERALVITGGPDEPARQ